MLHEAAHRNKNLSEVMSFGLIMQKNILFRQNGACLEKKTILLRKGYVIASWSLAALQQKGLY